MENMREREPETWVTSQCCSIGYLFEMDVRGFLYLTINRRSKFLVAGLPGLCIALTTTSL